MKKKAINRLFISICCSALLMGCNSFPTPEIDQFETQSETKTPIKSLGDKQYKIGNILVNKAERQFELTGKILRLDQPIEFLAVAKDGDRGYESLLELDTDVFQFNLACILIGLDKNKGTPPKFHFDPDPISGDSVEIWISWQTNGKNYRIEAATLLQLGETKLESGEWVYTGSSFLPGEPGGYMAEVAGGTLIGLVHDPASIIEHRVGFGDGSFRQLKLDDSLPLALDMPINILVKYNKK